MKKKNSKEKIHELFSLIGVDKDKCLNCHACISSCPVKYCNDGSGDYVKVSPNMCIGCGQCLAACTHNARYYNDDFDQLMKDLKAGENIIAIVAPSAAANFPEQLLTLNGWLQSIGIKTCFDVSFGAELTVKSYIHYIKKHKPKLVIGQACPAIVNFIEIYSPELYPYLIPVDSPMIHTMKMIRNFYPQYKNHKIAALSPCLAKKREFIETKHGDYNIGFDSLVNYFKENNINLSMFKEVEYESPPAERALGFSSPGGLLNTVKRWHPEIENKTRKIEGVSGLYSYLQTLEQSLKNNTNPLLIDCLNCEYGCNAGPLTPAQKLPPDELEARIQKRLHDNSEKHKPVKLDTPAKIHKYEKFLDKYWDAKLYQRNYKKMFQNNTIRIPTEAEKQAIFHQMYKFSEDDIYNCTSCGYNACDSMAIAIFNNENRPENCHFYLLKEAEYAHAEIIKQERRLQGIAKTLPGIICQLTQTKSGHYKFKYMSNKAITIFGIPKDEMLSFDYFFGRIDNNDQQRFLQTITDSITNDQPCFFEGRFIKEDGHILWIQGRGAPVKDQDDHALNVIFLDITDQKQTEMQLLQSRKMDSIGQLAGGIAHDFNNMLGGILGFSDLIMKKLEPDNKLTVFVKGIINAAESAADLTGKLLAFSRQAKTLSTPINIHETISATLQILERSINKKISIISELKAESPIIIGDPGQLQNAFLNLGLNARDAMADSEGTLSYTTTNVELDETFCNDSQFNIKPGSYIQITVEDTGSGIPKEIQEKIYDPFFTTKEVGEGTGLGLAAVYGTIKDHHGLIHLYSEEGEGTAFHLYFPIETSETRVEKSQYKDKKDIYFRGSGCLLIIDDEEIVRTMAEHLFKELGYTVIVAENGQEGLTKYELFKDKIDLIILDMIMPKMDGKECFYKIKQINKDAKVILSSGFTKNRSVSELMKQGVLGFIKKPYRRSEVCQILSSIFSDK